MENAKMPKVVTFGEVMMRLSPPGFATFSQGKSMDVTYGGGEANVAISLAYLGAHACHVTRFPDNNLGRSGTQFLRHHWIDTSHVLYGEGELGLYFLEKGAVHRPSEIIYQRARSSFALIHPEMLNWKEILKGARWFHWTGITPAVSEGAARCCEDAIKTANEMEITVSGDIHSRSTLWKYDKDPRTIMRTLIAGTDIVIASPHDMEKYVEKSGAKDFKDHAIKLMKEFPRIRKVVDKDRDSVSASHNKIKGKMWNGVNSIASSEYDISHIVDRIGTGDAFAAGLIYGLLNFSDESESLNFATAACSLKHSIEGDANLVSADNVMRLMEGDTSGKIQR